jgi:hypothetical protein
VPVRSIRASRRWELRSAGRGRRVSGNGRSRGARSHPVHRPPCRRERGPVRPRTVPSSPAVGRATSNIRRAPGRPGRRRGDRSATGGEQLSPGDLRGCRSEVPGMARRRRPRRIGARCGVALPHSWRAPWRPRGGTCSAGASGAGVRPLLRKFSSSPVAGASNRRPQLARPCRSCTNAAPVAARASAGTQPWRQPGRLPGEAACSEMIPVARCPPWRRAASQIETFPTLDRRGGTSTIHASERTNARRSQTVGSARERPRHDK